MGCRPARPAGLGRTPSRISAAWWTSTTRRLLPPGDMPGRLRALAEAAGEPVPSTEVGMVRMVLDSLALAYRRTIRTASSIAGVRLEVVHVVGGGSQNELLCQLTADACGLPVVAGPTEAAALGNVLVQARSLGETAPRPGRRCARCCVVRSRCAATNRTASRGTGTRPRNGWADRDARSPPGHLPQRRPLPRHGQGRRHAAAPARRRGGVPRGPDLLWAADGQHRLPRRGRAGRSELRGRLRLVRRRRDAVRIVRRLGTPPAAHRRQAVRGHALAGAGRQPRATGLRALGVPRRRARGDRRRCVVPAHGDLPPDVSLVARPGRG